MPAHAPTERTFEFFTVGFHGDRHLLRIVHELAGSCGAFIETGANTGSTLAYVARTYPRWRCLSCEIDREAYARAAANTALLGNVELKHSDSLSFLKGMLLDEPLRRCTPLFWLDAHGYGFQWPLAEEVSFVTTHFLSGRILIDDFRVPGREVFGYDSYDGQVCDWEHIVDSLARARAYCVRYPAYTERTSSHHPLRGWVLIEWGTEPLAFSPRAQDLVSKPAIQSF